MTWGSVACFAVLACILLSMIRKGADPVSPARVFGAIWTLALGLVQLKLSALQRDWEIESWLLLLIGIGAYLVGAFCMYVLNVDKPLQPISAMRTMLRTTELDDRKLFRLICISVLVYGVSYVVIYAVKGFLPVFVVGTKISRVDFYVFGFGVLINSTAFIIFFTVLYAVLVRGRKAQKLLLAFLATISLGSYFLLLQRFQVIMSVVLCFVLLYYATTYVRLRTALLPFALGAGVFYWISSLRFSNVVATFLYSTSKMRFTKTYAMLTEPYMYVVMNLENFANAAARLEQHTYGYFSLDFIVAFFGLKYPLQDYFVIDRFPFLFSSYNTYTAFWWFYEDFGIPGLAIIPFLLGTGTAWVYYKMRRAPSIPNVTAYGMMIFTSSISFFVFPIAFLWFEYNALALYLILRWTLKPRREPAGEVPMPETANA
jgi:oligosaccharide repeat unit polymerase